MSAHAVLQLTILLIGLMLPAPAWPEQSKPGFLLVAPDRGFLGNQEIHGLYEEFKKTYSAAALALVGRDYNGMGSEYSGYLARALEELNRSGVNEVVVIPLFLSQADPILQKVVKHLPAYPGAGTVRWAGPMADSFLVRQIVLDRVETLSRDPEHERLLLAGFGAVDQDSEAGIRTDLERLLHYVGRYKRFKETRAVVYYDRAATGAEEKNQAADQMVMKTAAKKGRTLLVLAAIGPKFDQSMALTSWIRDKFAELDLVYAGEELLPHANVLLWLKKTANAHLPASDEDIGVIIMPHGATQPYNDAIERTIAPLKSRYRIEMAYGMGDPGVIQQAVSRLEQQGVRRIVFVRMYALAHHLKERVEYMLGLSETPAAGGHDEHDQTPPPQIRSAALFATFGGYEEDPRIARILHERIMEVSQDPSRETVIVLSHGDKSDDGNAQWLGIMNANIELLKKDPHCARLKLIRAATVREDWPDKREPAVAEVRRMIEGGARDGRVLIIADRLYGSGPYRRFLKGLDYAMNENGLAHPFLTTWLEDGIRSALAEQAARIDRAATSRRPGKESP